jgi:hypothetical protein
MRMTGLSVLADVVIMRLAVDDDRKRFGTGYETSVPRPMGNHAQPVDEGSAIFFDAEQNDAADRGAASTLGGLCAI